MFDDEDEEQPSATPQTMESDEETQDREAEPAPKKSQFVYDARKEEALFDEDEDDLDDFIVEDEEDDEGVVQERRKVRQQKKREKPRSTAIFQELGIGNEYVFSSIRFLRSCSISNEIYEIFGDGNDYAYALGYDSDGYEEDTQKASAPKRLEDVC